MSIARRRDEFVLQGALQTLGECERRSEAADGSGSRGVELRGGAELPHPYGAHGKRTPRHESHHIAHPPAQHPHMIGNAHPRHGPSEHLPDMFHKAVHIEIGPVGIVPNPESRPVQYRQQVRDESGHVSHISHRLLVAAAAHHQESSAGDLPQQIKKARNLSVFGNTSPETDTLPKAQRAYVEPAVPNIAADPVVQYMSKAQMEKSIERTRKLMQEAAKKLEFIEAAQYRDELLKMEDLMKEKWG